MTKERCQFIYLLIDQVIDTCCRLALTSARALACLAIQHSGSSTTGAALGALTWTLGARGV